MNKTVKRELPRTRRLAAAIWGLRLIWRSSSILVLGLLVTATVRGIVPAGFAIAVRGLVNSATEAVGQEQYDTGRLVFWLVLALVITVVEVLVTLVSKLLIDFLRNDLTLDINCMVMRHASSLDLPFLENAENRELLGRMRHNPGARVNTMFVKIVETVISALQVVSLIAVLAWLEPLVLVVSAVVAIPYLLFSWRLAGLRYVTEHNRTRNRRWSSYFLSKVTSPSTIAEIKQLRLGELLAERFAATLAGFRLQDRFLQKKQFGGSALFSLLTIVAFYILFARVVFRVVEGALTIGDMAIFAGAVARLRSALQKTIRSASQAYEQTFFIADLGDFLDSRPQVRDVEGASQNPLSGTLTVDNVSFTYPASDHPVIRGISFNIEAGERIAIVGENGSGKSTLAKLLVRLYDVDSGSICIDDKPIESYKLSHLHSRVALMGQSPGRYEASLAENIAYGDWERLSEDREAIERIARITGLNRIAQTLPSGLDTELGRQFSDHDLSTGQWQLLAIARTLARNASVLILDEPTANIDARSELSLFEAIEQMTENVTTIIISHRFSTIRMMDRILTMEQGRIVEEGTHDELMAAGGKYRSLYLMHEQYRAVDR